MFNKNDSNIIQYNVDENITIEPVCYMPIIPLILVNGSRGIGSGFSTHIPSFNPIDIIQYIKHLNNNTSNLNNNTSNLNTNTIKPYIVGYQGKLEIVNNKIVCLGKYILCDNQILITELPPNIHLDEYNELLNSYIDKKIIKGFKNYSTESVVCYNIFISNSIIDSYTHLQLIKLFKLQSKIPLTNIVCFDETQTKILKFDTIYQLIDYYYNV